VLGEAISHTLLDLAHGLLLVVIVCVSCSVAFLAYFAILDWINRRKKKTVRKLQLAEPVDLSEEIKVHDRARRGPERVAGPESRERLPFSGRRSA
jgi:hypothetical protein